MLHGVVCIGRGTVSPKAVAQSKHSTGTKQINVASLTVPSLGARGSRSIPVAAASRTSKKLWFPGYRV